MFGCMIEVLWQNFWSDQAKPSPDVYSWFLVRLTLILRSPLLTQKSTHWNPRASVRRVTESQPSVPVNLTWNWQERKQSQIREHIGWDSEYLLDGRIGKLCRYYRQQKDIKCKRVVKERIGRISRCTKRQNRLWIADRVFETLHVYVVPMNV